MALTVRTYFPSAPDYMVINAWALAPNDETAWARKYRLNNFLEFLGPGGFASPDDAEALEHCQRGFKNSKEAMWNDISKGMGKDNPRTMTNCRCARSGTSGTRRCSRRRCPDPGVAA